MRNRAARPIVWGLSNAVAGCESLDQSATPRRLDHARLAPVLVGSVAFVVYLRTLMPGAAFGDWGEMQTVAHVLGVAHPTGYPTYILLVWLGELPPLGSVAFRANLLSALFVAVALAALTATSLRLGVRPLVAAAAALALGAVGTIWAAATVSEVNPLHLMFAALILHRAVVWEDERRPRDLAIGGLLVGLALGNHLLTLFVAPFVAAHVLWSGRREIAARPWILARGVVALLAALLVYAYVPLAAAASPVLAYNHPVTLDRVVWLVTGAQFRGQFDFLSTRGASDLRVAAPALWDLLVSRGTLVLPVLGLVGLALLVRRRPAFAAACIAILATGGYIWASYLRLEHYLLVPWLVLGVGIAVALEASARLAERIVRRPWRPIGGHAVGVVAVGLALGVTVTNWSTADRSTDQSGQQYIDAVFASLPPNAAILTYWDASTPLWYGRFIEGRRPDVLVVDDTNIVFEGWGTRERRIASLICDRPVFILRLNDRDLGPTRHQFRLTTVLDVRVAAGGPSATTVRPIYRVEPFAPGACAG